MDPIINNVIVLNKANNRGDSVTSEWIIYKQDPSSGIYNIATYSTDYTLGVGETLTSDQITLTWAGPGNYRVVNHSTGLSSGTTGPNDNTSIINFNVALNIVDTVTLPVVTALIEPVVAYNNTEVSLDPLTGITSFSFTVTGVIDTSRASWVQTINAGVPTTLALSDAAWTTEVLSRCSVYCQVKLGTSVVQSRVGLGPHVFNVSAGTYQAGFHIIPKIGTSLTSTLAETLGPSV
jgi:hypothetical protein